MSAHTPGPWLWERNGCELRGEGQVLRIDCPEFISDDDKSLIAAAPDLLAALKVCEEVLSRQDTLRHLSPENPPLDGARAAITKAEGK